MGVKWKTKVNKLPEMTATAEAIGNHKVKVGAFKGENAWIAGVHEFGCDIRAKRARYLTVPIHPDSVGKKAREIPDLFFFEAASGEKFLAKGDGDNLIFYYWLTPSVKIPERSFLRTGHDENHARVLEQTERALGQVLAGKMSMDKLLDTYGEQMASAIKNKIRDINSPPNSPVTILAKGSSNPLIDSGGLLESIDWKKE
jgi:hypothetical protein